VTPKIVVDTFKVLPDGKAELVLKNTGLAHRVLKGIRVFVKTNDQNRTEIKNEQMDEMQGENILAMSSRRFNVALPAAMIKAEKAQPGSVKAEIEF
jgi:hypothetical protein